ncbi:MAG: LysR family transcriptional regulator [Zymomonas mobilis]|uniref:DNA-binding transcriptional LysR family regulator n=1 Tax=Zymomonas mobilis TaxID=542 RepID=A0A542VZ53_ZYMMB|nr:LysR family transcriptional regulator [Zymomonas mobilis]TQL16604.1 DNA-binding transcriptional LysR family regulator [Zymomonas mobilis]
MTLEQLRIFVSVAERQHMTAASQALHLSQSAVSSAIAALENRYGVKLFHRVGRGICLSEAGQLFLEEARSILRRAETAEIMLSEMGGLKRGTLRLVASQTIASYWLPPQLLAFRKRYRLLNLDVAIGNTEQAALQVEQGNVDLGFVEGAVDHPSLAHWPIGQDHLLLVRSAPFPEKAIDADYLRSACWVVREKGSGTRSTFDQFLRLYGVDPDSLKTVLVLPSNESVRTAVEAGAGISALSSFVVTPAIMAGSLYAADLELMPRPFFALRHKERYRSKAADAFLDLIGEILPK